MGQNVLSKVLVYYVCEAQNYQKENGQHNKRPISYNQKVLSDKIEDVLIHCHI